MTGLRPRSGHQRADGTAILRHWLRPRAGATRLCDLYQGAHHAACCFRTWRPGEPLQAVLLTTNRAA